MKRLIPLLALAFSLVAKADILVSTTPPDTTVQCGTNDIIFIRHSGPTGGDTYSCVGSRWQLNQFSPQEAYASNTPTVSFCLAVSATDLTKWTFVACGGGGGGGGATTLDGLTDVTITSPATGASLKYNGSQWVNGALDLADSDAVAGILPTANLPTSIAYDAEVAAAYQPLDADLTQFAGLNDCGGTSLRIPQIVGGVWTCQPPAAGGSVTNIATTSPLTGGPVTTTGTIACPTCTTNASALTANRVVLGAGSQATTVTAADSTTTHALFATAGAPAFRAIAVNDIPTLNQPTTASAGSFTGALLGDVGGVQGATVIGTGKVTSTHILDNTIVNADISSSAAIDGSKIVAATGALAGVVTTSSQTIAGVKSFTSGISTGSPLDGTRGDEFIDNSATCQDPAAGNTAICTIGGVVYTKDTGTAVRALVQGTGSTAHGVILWGVKTATNAAFDTGTEVCVAAGLTCVTTFDTIATPWTAIACGTPHTAFDGWLAECD